MGREKSERGRGMMGCHDGDVRGKGRRVRGVETLEG